MRKTGILPNVWYGYWKCGVNTLLNNKISGFVWSPVCFLVNSDAYISKIGINRDIFEDFTAAATSLMTVGLNLKTFVGNGNLA